MKVYVISRWVTDGYDIPVVVCATLKKAHDMVEGIAMSEWGDCDMKWIASDFKSRKQWNSKSFPPLGGPHAFNIVETELMK